MAPAPTSAASLAVPCFLVVVLLSLPGAVPAGAVHSDSRPTSATTLLSRGTEGRRLRALALAEVFGAEASATATRQETKAQNPLPSGWFGSFSQDESTYAAEGVDASKQDPDWAVQYGRDPSLEAPLANTEVFKSEWFHESPSGGPKAAWQTNYPSISASVAGNHVPENPWRQTPSGWVQEYRPMLDESAVGPGSADWFDNSIRQIDGFGRKMNPGLSGDWKERSVNTTITCAKPGCSANSSIQLYNAKTEEATMCRLSINVHPTDYDDDFGHEYVDWKVNGYVAMRECNPRARGCNSTAERPLYPCLNGFNVDKLVSSAGTLVIEGKNSQMVDECPYKSNLLSGVALATCMVRKVQAQTTTLLSPMSDLVGEGVMTCNTPGCTAETLVQISPTLALNGGKCTMNISVHQTDYDDKTGEQIDFIQVEGTNITKAPLQPGENPCNSQYKNKTLAASKLVFAAVTSYDVTQLVKKSHPLGSMRVTGKISSQVDECGYKGNLLHGNITVRCVPPAKFAATPPSAATLLVHTPPAQAPATNTILLQRSASKHRRAA